MRRILLPSALTCALACAARPAAGQRSSQGSSAAAAPRARYAAGLVAGASQFDLSGTGTTAFVGARIEAEVRRWLVAEGAVGFFRPNEQGGYRDRYTVPEAQLQLQLPGRLVRPYLGAGGGWVIESGGGGAHGTTSGAGGLRVAPPGSRVDARGELRVRGIAPAFSGSTAEWTLGAAYRF